MKISNSSELIGKEVFDAKGTPIGWVDKTWNSWNQEYPGYFFGIKTNDHTKNTFFRGQNKLIPVYNDFISTVGTTITLNRTIDDLMKYWNKTVPCGPTPFAVDELIEMPVYDKYNSRVGTFTTYIENNGQISNLGVLLDPFICEKYHLPYNTTYPVEAGQFNVSKNTITLNQAFDELKQYWQQNWQHNWQQKQHQY